jgi:hypothetical protein
MTSATTASISMAVSRYLPPTIMPQSVDACWVYRHAGAEGIACPTAWSRSICYIRLSQLSPEAWRAVLDSISTRPPLRSEIFWRSNSTSGLNTRQLILFCSTAFLTALSRAERTDPPVLTSMKTISIPDRARWPSRNPQSPCDLPSRRAGPIREGRRRAGPSG